MTFPSSGSGYPQQGGTPQQQPQGPGSGGFQQPPQAQFPQQGYQQAGYQQAGGGMTATLNMGVFLALAVTLLGLVNYLISFSRDAQIVDTAVQFLLIGALLAALRMLPQGPRVMPFVALTSVLGALHGILGVVRVPEGAEVPGLATVLLILGILQMLVAVAALLFDYEVIKLPAGAQQPYGTPFPQQYGQQYGYNQQQGQGQFQQPTQYGPPVTSSGQTPQAGQQAGQQAPAGQQAQPGQQPTQYAAQQGQFFPPQSSESGEQSWQTGQQ